LLRLLIREEQIHVEEHPTRVSTQDLNERLEACGLAERFTSSMMAQRPA
jgi:hypothetical protein